MYDPRALPTLTDRALLTAAAAADVLEEQQLDDPAELALLSLGRRLRGCVAASERSSALGRGPRHVRPEAAALQLLGGARDAGGDASSDGGRAAAAGGVDGR